MRFDAGPGSEEETSRLSEEIADKVRGVDFDTFSLHHLSDPMEFHLGIDLKAQPEAATGTLRLLVDLIELAERAIGSPPLHVSIQSHRTG